MIFKYKRHNSNFYSTLLNLSRNIFFYKEITLKDTFETRIYLIFFHFSLILLNFKYKKVKFPQSEYDSLFFNIENNLRELGFGDVGVNKKMKDMNKIFYDILLKLNKSENGLKLNKEIILKYFPVFKEISIDKYNLLDAYFNDFYNFCFEKDPKNMIKEVSKFIT